MSASFSFKGRVEVGTATAIKSITRTSSSQDWQDGNEGNNESLVFSASEFSNYDTAATPNGPEGYAIQQSTHGAPVRPTFGGIQSSASGASGNQIVAVKLIPTGFKIKGTPFTLSCDHDVTTGTIAPFPLWSPGTRPAKVSILTTDIALPMAPNVSLIGPLDLSNGVSGGGGGEWEVGLWTSSTSLTESSPGSGTLAAVAQLIIASGQQMSRVNGGIVSVIIPLVRI